MKIVIKNREHITTKETRLILEHFLSLSQEDLRLRFMRTMNEWLIDEWLTTTLQTNRYQTRFVLIFKDEEETQIIGLGQLCIEKTSPFGEISLSVSPDQRGNGFAEQIFKLLIEQSKKARIEELYLMCCGTNAPVIHLAKKLNFKMSRQEGDMVGVLGL